DRDATGRIQRLRATHGGRAIALGTAADRFIFATGFDPLLAASGAVAANLFPIAGTSITFRLPPSAIAQGLRFPRRAWKHDGFAGPLVISPTFSPSADFLGWLDGLADRGTAAIDPRDLTGDRAGFIDPNWCATETAIDPATLDPRQLDRFQPDALGPAAGDWEIRIGGCKFYPGVDRPLDLDHPGAQWALRSQLIAAHRFFPEVLAHNLGRAIDPGDIPLDAIGSLNPWVGPRPVYADGQAIVRPCAPNGFAISGTGSWGLASGPGNGAIAAQWLATSTSQ
ncbi:MAG TPA: FAD-dependent oxidoreductase, partial [Coleofasciculaceae cyanobacterium]